MASRTDLSAHGSALIDGLLAEWETLAHDRAICRTVRRWGRYHSALSGLSSPAQIVEHCDQADRETQDKVFAALIELAQAHQDPAGRIVVHMMLPKIASLAWKTRAHADSHLEDHRHVVLAHFWTVLATYDITRRTTVRLAASLSLDTLNLITRPRERRVEEVLVDPTEHLENGSAVPDFASEVVGALSPHTTLDEVLESDVARTVLSESEIELLALLATDLTSHQMAQHLGITLDAFWQRKRRAKQRLVEAVQAEFAADQHR